MSGLALAVRRRTALLTPRSASAVVAAWAVLLPLVIARIGIGPRGFIGCAFALVLVALAAIDIERRILPNRIVLPAFAAVLAAQIFFFPAHAPQWVIASLATSLFLLLPVVVRRDAMGLGDVKLGLLLGAGLGKHVMLALVLGCVALWPVAALFVLRVGLPAARRTTIPFGPFLAGGAIAALLLTG